MSALPAGATTAGIRAHGDSVPVDENSPIVWADGDEVRGSMMYEAA